MDDLEALKRLAGVGVNVEQSLGSNISMTASEKSRIMREKDIKPGTPAWFQLWFSKPYLTGEKPYK